MDSSRNRLLFVGLAMLFSAIAMITTAAALVIDSAPQSFWSKYGIGYVTLGIIVFILGAAVLFREIDPRRPSRAYPEHDDTPLHALLSHPHQTRPHRAAGDLESGLAARYRGPAGTARGRETIGHPYPRPRLQLTATGMPDSLVCDMAATASRAAHVHRAQHRPSGSLSSYRARARVYGATDLRAPRRAADTQVPLRKATSASRATQTAMRNVRGPRVEERMPGGMAPMTFWWLLLEEQRRETMAREPRTGRRFSL